LKDAADLRIEKRRYEIENRNIVAPNPPINVMATENPDGTVALTWTPPMTNEDGSPISDLLGYNIYMVAEQNRCEAVSAVSGDTTPLVCERSGTGGGGGVPMYNVNGPALSFDGTDYNSSPLGETALWLNVDDQENTIKPLPLADSEVVDPTKPVFAVLLNIEFTARTGMPAGEHKLTAYTQNTTAEIERWLGDANRYASLTPSSRIILHALACETFEAPGDDFTSLALPLNSIPLYVYEALNASVVSGDWYIVDRTIDPEAHFAVKSVDSATNVSKIPNIGLKENGVFLQ